jgi:hypothetical protein
VRSDTSRAECLLVASAALTVAEVCQQVAQLLKQIQPNDDQCVPPETKNPVRSSGNRGGIEVVGT